MLFLDLDGTIVGRKNALSEAIRKGLIEAREAGVRMAICTGRTSRGLSEEIAEVMAPHGPHIFESGAAIVRMDTHEILHAFPMEQKVALDIAEVAMQIAEKYDAAAEFYTDAGVFISKKTADSILHAKALKIDPDSVVKADVREIAQKHQVIRVQWVAQKDALELALERNPKETTVAVASAHAIPHCLFASVTKKGIDKGTAAKIVAEEYWGGTLAECYGAGDSDGDVPFLKLVGHPYIMGSAKAELKETYPVVPDVEHDGVLEILATIRRNIK